MELLIDNEFRKICKTIEAEHKSEKDWAVIESMAMPYNQYQSISPQRTSKAAQIYPAS